MQLKLTFKVKDGHPIDLMVDENQKIAETMQVLAERELLDGEPGEAQRFIRSMRTNKQVSVLLTYSEAGIYSGDVLELERLNM